MPRRASLPHFANIRLGGLMPRAMPLWLIIALGSAPVAAAAFWVYIGGPVLFWAIDTLSALCLIGMGAAVLAGWW